MGLTLEVGKTYVTRTGHKVRIVAVDRAAGVSEHPVVGLRLANDGVENAVIYRLNGTKGDVPDYTLVKEYVEPIKVRIIVYKHRDSRAIHTASYPIFASGLGVYSKEAMRQVYREFIILSDTVVEVELN